MARTQAADYGAKRAAILDAAAALFARAGFAGVSMAEIAAACDASKSLIYHYYASKEDMLYAVMASHIDQLSADVAAVPARGDPAERLRALTRRFMGHYVGAADRQKVLLNDLACLPEPRRAEIKRRQRALVDTVVALLGEIDPALAADPPRAKARAMMFFGMINWTHTWYDPAGPLGPDAIADMAWGLATRQAS